MNKEAEHGGISRRNLIKGAGVVGAASLVAGLVGCASPFQPSAGEAGGGSGPASGAQGGTHHQTPRSILGGVGVLFSLNEVLDGDQTS